MPTDLSVPLDPSREALRIAHLPAQVTPTRGHLRQLFIARNVVLLVGLIGVAGMAAAESALRSPGIVGILGALTLINLLTWLRLNQPVPVSYNHLLLQILADVVLLSAAMCVSGGDMSPLEDLYFVPLTIAAATLPWRHTLFTAAAILGSRLFACHFYVPVPAFALPEHEMVELLTGALIAYFAFCMASTSRKHEQMLARIREDYLKQRHLTELGAMAAATADRMSSPLGTIAVIVGELRDSVYWSVESRQALDMIASRIELCKQALSRLFASASFGRGESACRMPADKFLEAMVDKCQLLQPWMTVQCRYEGGLPGPAVLVEASLEQAILVLLNSTAAWTPMQVEVSGRLDENCLRIQIRTAGLLPAPDAAAYAGVPLFARKAVAGRDRQDLFMAKATISGLGVTIEEARRPDGHAWIKLSLPLADLAA